jgi:nicotinamide-nucleotide amidase
MTDSLEQLAADVGRALQEREWKLATAESCTGGGIAYYLTSVSGSSNWFERGFVSYSNVSKQELLGVSISTIEQFGAVSEATAREMAEGALQHSQAQVSVAVTGVAGPTGGTKDKPVGTVWFAWAGTHRETKTLKLVFSGDRKEVREQTVRIALAELLGFTCHTNSG